MTTNLAKARSFLDMMNQGFFFPCPFFHGRIRVAWRGCFVYRSSRVWMFHFKGQDDDQFWLWSSNHECSGSTSTACVTPLPFFLVLLYDCLNRRLYIDFHWCGYAIDMKDLSISVDYTRYHGISEFFSPMSLRLRVTVTWSWWNESSFFFLDLSSTLTITRGRKPGLGFVRKMLKWGYVVNEKSGFFVFFCFFCWCGAF